MNPLNNISLNLLQAKVLPVSAVPQFSGVKGVALDYTSFKNKDLHYQDMKAVTESLAAAITVGMQLKTVPVSYLDTDKLGTQVPAHYVLMDDASGDHASQYLRKVLKRAKKLFGNRISLEAIEQLSDRDKQRLEERLLLLKKTFITPENHPEDVLYVSLVPKGDTLVLTAIKNNDDYAKSLAEAVSKGIEKSN